MADFGEFHEAEDGATLVHIRLQQRGGRKCLTTVSGVVADTKKLLNALKKALACNGSVVDHPEYGQVLQLQGDKRDDVCEFLVKCGLVNQDSVRMHGS